MKRTKRFLAFALAFMMFMTNTVSASATSLSSGSNINGTTTVSSDTTVDTDENGSTDPSGKGETAEPSGEDASSQDGVNGGSGTTDNGQTTPEGNTPSTDGTSAGGTGEESSEDTSQSASTEETTEETSEETVEETTEEETTEVMEADLLKDEVGEVHTTMEDGDVVSVYMSETTYYFASIAAAIDYIDENGNNDDGYYISQITKQSLSVSGDDLVTNKNRKITLDMSNDILVGSSSSSTADTARINIGLSGDGKLTMGEHTSLQLIHNEDEYSWRSGGVRFPKTNAGDLIIGEENEVYDGYIVYMREELTIENAQKICAYAPFQWESIYSDDGRLLEKVDLMVKNLTVDVHIDSSSDYLYPIIIGGSITAENFTLLSGDIEVVNLTVSDGFSAQDGSIFIYKKADIHDLTVPESSDPKKIFLLYRVDSYTGTVSEDNLICAASIRLSGKLDINHYMNWSKANCVKVDESLEGYYSYTSTSPYAEGDTLATVTLEEGQDIDLSPFMALEKYAVVNYDGTSYELAASEVIGQENTYALKMVKSSNMITLKISDGTDTAEKGFATLTAVKDYISTKANANRSYSIRMNQPATASGSDLDYRDVTADTVSLDLNGNKLTLSEDAMIALDFIDGFKYNDTGVIAGTSSQIDAKTKSIANLSILPRKQYASVKGISILTAANTTTLALGGDYSGSDFSFDALVSGKLKGLYLKGNVDVLSTTAVSAAKVVVDRANNENGRAYFANLQADALYMEEGNVEVRTAAVSGTLTISEECGLTVAPTGTFTVKDIEIIDGEDEGARANIELQRRMTVTDQENPSLEGAKQAAVAGTLKITGNVALADQNPLGVRKTWVYQKTTDEGTWDARGGEEDFISGEAIATVTNTKVPASYFTVESQSDMMTVERSGSLLKAVKPTVRVIQIGETDNKDVCYKTLEDAVKNMATDFDGSASGRFDIVLLDDVKLTANVTIPAFVKELQLVTEETAPDTYGSPVYAYRLDLNGKTLTTTASVNMSSGVRMKSSVAASGKFVINRAADANGLNINECRALVDKYGNEIADRLPVLDNVIVTAKDAYVYLKCDTVRAGSDHGMKASFDVHDIFVIDGNWTLNTTGKTASYVKAEDEIVLEEGTSLSADQIKASNLFVWKDASLSAAQMTFSGNYVEVYGHLETDILTLTGAYVDINKQDEFYGYVEVGTLTATNSEINMQDNACQLMCKGNATLTGTELGLWGGNITVNGNMTLTGSSLELQGTLDVAGNITSATSRIRISKDEDENRSEEENRYGNLYVNDLTINSAYAGDASGDHTLDNECCVLVKGKLTMKAGTLRNADIVEVKTANVKDMVNEGSFLCDTFTNTGKLTLKSDSVMLINQSGTVNNVVLDYYSNEGNASLGRGGKEATVTLNGTFTAKQEDTQLNAFVTDAYKDKIGDFDEHVENEGQDDEYRWKEYLFDWIMLWDDNNTAEEDDDHDQSYVERLALGTSVFSTGIKTFPVENINVLPWKYNDAGEGETANWVDNDNNAVYQSGKELLVAGNCIHVCVEHAGGETAGDWKNFSSWNDAVTYIDSLNNSSAVYRIEISAETFDINGTMTLPTKASKVVIASALGHYEDKDGEETEEAEGNEWISHEVSLQYQGDITQKTDLTFEYIDLLPHNNKNGSTVNTNGKTLEFVASYVNNYGSSDSDECFKAIKGTKTTTLRLVESGIAVNDTITGIDRVEVLNGSLLEIKKGGLSVNELYTEDWPEYQEKYQEEPDYLINWIALYDDKAVLEVKENFDMASKTYVHSAGTMKFKNISSNCEGNILETANEDSITITGSVYSWDGKALSDTTSYVAVYSESALLGYRMPKDSDYKDDSSPGGIESESQEREFKDDLKVIYVPKYAIRINTVNSGGDILATAAAVSSSWFITDKDLPYGSSTTQGINLTRKENGKIWRGEKASAPITLFEVKGYDTKKQERITAQLDQFDSLQEAFNEIDRLGNTEAEYLITLNGISDDKKRPGDVTVYEYYDDSCEKSVRVADKNVNSKNDKTIDYTFPSKAAEVVIESDRDDPQAIVYSKNLTLKTNLTLENVALYAETATEKSTGTIALGGNRLILNGVYMQKNCNAFTGSGVEKGSALIVDSSDLLATKVSQISLVELVNGSRLLSAGEITIGDLTANLGSKFGGFGKITIGNIEANDNLTLYTKPKFTEDKNGVYTKSEPTMTVSGSINGNVTFSLTGDSSVTESGLVNILDRDSDKLLTLLSDNDNGKDEGVAFVKAPNASTENIVISGTSGEWQNGTIYKKSGNFVFKYKYPQVKLSYTVGDEETAYTFETYEDAINEINNLKTKRDYTIKFLAGNDTNPTDIKTPITLTMPKAGMADHLTLTAQCDVFIKGDITMNTNVVLEDINFVQVITESGNDYTVDGYVSEKGEYVNPLNIKVNGAYELRIQDEVTFNNAIALNGGGKAFFTMSEAINGKDAGSLKASYRTVRLEDTKLFVQGTIKNFAEVNLYTGCKAAILPYGSGKTTNTVYKPAEVDVTALNIPSGASFEVGYLDFFYGYHGGSPVVSTLKVKELNMADSSEICVCGTAAITDACLGDGAILAVAGQTFNITGTLTVSGTPVLQTAPGQKTKQSVLNISGKVVRTNPKDKVQVEVVLDNDVLGDWASGEDLYLGGSYTDKNGKTVSISNKLLTAKNAEASVFIPYSIDKTDTCLNPDNWYPYGLVGGEYENGHGYILMKSGSDILVHYGSEVEAVVYIGSEAEGERYGYYTDFNAAVAAIDALKDTKAEYTIKVLHDVGSSSNTEKVNLPAKAAKVTITTENDSAIYYNNDLNLGCDTEFTTIQLNPAGASGKEKGINTKGFALTLTNIQDNTEEGDAVIGKITGNGKEDSVTICNQSSDLIISGDVTKIKDLTLKEERTEEESPAVTVTGKVTVTNLISEKYNWGNKQNKLIIQGKGSSLTNVEAKKEILEIDYPDLNITGEISVADNSNLILCNTTAVKAAMNGSQRNLTKNNVLLTVKNANLSEVVFYMGLLGPDNHQPAVAAWANGAVYALDDYANTVVVKGTKTVSGENESIWATCLDMTQASAYINARADKDMTYTIELYDNITDTCVTDKTERSTLTLPKADTMKSLEVSASSGGRLGQLSFTGDVKVNGNVIFRKIKLQNDKDFSFILAKNSDSKVNGVKVSGESSLTLDNAQIVTTEDGKGNSVGNIKNITGVKDVSKLSMDHVINAPEEGALEDSCDLTGGITKVAVMELKDCSLKTLGASDVAQFVNDSNGEWTALGKTTIGSVSLKKDATLGTTLVKGVPQLTITGEVTDISSEGGKKVIVKLYDYDSANKVYKEHSEMVAEAEQSSCYDDTPLVIVAKAPADLFIAYPYVENMIESISAYKDAKNYVYNGDTSKMEAIVETLDADGNSMGWTYAKTYADAITLINSMGNKDGYYNILLRHTADNGGVIKTAVKNGVAEYGALTLPNANAAASVTITSDGSSSSDPVTIKYTGTLQPKGTMKLTFDDVILTEGKINAKAEDGFDESNTITLVLGTAEVTFTRSVTTPDAVDTAKKYVTEGSGLEDFYWIEDEDEDCVGLVFTKITGSSGTLNLTGSSAFVIGDANVKNLVMNTVSDDSNAYIGILQVFGKTTIGNVKLNALGGQLICKNAISIGNVIKGEKSRWTDPYNLYLITAYTQKELTKASSQLSITGEADPGVKIKLYQYCYDVAGGKYRMLTDEELEKVLWNPDEKAASYQKLITAPKMSVNNYSTIIYLTKDFDSYFDEENSYLYKYYYAKVDGNIYLTEEEPAIEVSVRDNEGYTVYDTTFYSWDQAVKEIDKLGHSDWDYEINLLDNLGTDGTPLKSLNMPTKVKSLSIDAEWYTVILTTATNITLKTDTYIGDVQIFGVKKSGNRYYSTPYTINVGKNFLSLWYMWPDGLDFSGHVDGIGYLESQMKLTGTAQGSAYIGMANVVDEYGKDTESQYMEQITQITNIGTVFMDWLNLTGYDEEPYSNIKPCTYAVKDGISGVGTLILNPEVYLECTNKDVNVKNLTLGLRYDYDTKEIEDIDKNLSSFVMAPNITVSNTLTMAGSELHAGVSTGSDGKVILKDIVVYDNDNRIYAKQDKNGKSQIKITGTTTTAGENIRPDEGAITLGLYYHNSTSRFVQLTDGLVFANAPKAATSLFRVNSAWEDSMNMGYVPEAEIFEIEYDNEGNPIVAKDEGGNYIQGWDDEHYVLATDEKGDPIYVLDEGGNKIRATDGEGQSITDDNGKPVYLCVFYKTGSHLEDTYGLYRLGNDIVYGKLKTQDWDSGEWTDDMEVRVWIDGEPWEAPYLDFATFEEAVKAIDSMGLQKDVPGTNGKTTKAYLNYTIQFNRNVEIGNEKQNNKYNALTLPSKVSQLTIDGWGEYGITFSGNVTLKSNTVFKNVTLKPVKLVKNELVSDDKINLAVGNYQATLENAYFFAVDDGSDWPQMPINNVTGSAKGELILVGGTWLEVRGNVTGLNRIVLTQKSQHEDKNGESVTDFGGMWINGNTTVKEIRFEDAAAQMGCMGSLTANMIYVSAESEAQIVHPDATPIKLNGAASYVDGEGNTIKENVSVVIEEAPEGSDEGADPNEGADPVDPNCLILYMIPSKADVKTGTKVVTGKYLDNTQWTLLVGAESEGEDDTTYTSYMNGSDICVGSAVTTD